MPFAAEKEEGGEGNAVDIRNEEEDDVKEEVPWYRLIRRK